MSAPAPLYLQVAVPRRLHRVFTYSAPHDQAGPWQPGMRVRVPFGKGIVTGYIVSVDSAPETGDRPRRIRDVLARLDERPSIAPDLLALAEWVSERYVAPLGQCLRLAFPETHERRAAALTKAPESAADQPRATHRPRPAASTDVLRPLRKKAVNALDRRVYESVLLPAAADDALEFYLDLVERTLNLGRGALVLIPEADRVEASRAVFEARWGASCQVYHGGLSPADRRRAWTRIQEGEAPVVIGTRSAVFAPLPNLGLVIVDQEDHPAFKAEPVPRYDARAVAAERARRAGALAVMASAHPSLETMHATRTDPAELFPQAVQRDGPPVAVADLRGAPYGDTLSPPLLDAVQARLAARKTVLLYLNRKGYASVLLCRDCGQALQCPACSVGWTFHKQQRLLRCGHCGRTGQPPETCPACSGSRLLPAGSGTEALEETVRERFPAARVARLERQRAGGDRANAAILSLWHAGELDILIGTQLVVTRSPRPVASFIGLVHPDAALHLPDFRAAERAYHTLRDVLALADLRDPDAAAALQTYMPEHHVIQALAQHDPALFYEHELAARRALGYPPFGHLIGLRVTGKKEDLVEKAAVQWAALLQKAAVGNQIEILGPIPATPERLRGRSRRQLILKGTDSAALRDAVRRTLEEMEASSHAGDLRYDIDVDPQSLM